MPNVHLHYNIVQINIHTCIQTCGTSANIFSQLMNLWVSWRVLFVVMPCLMGLVTLFIIWLLKFFYTKNTRDVCMHMCSWIYLEFKKFQIICIPAYTHTHAFCEKKETEEYYEKRLLYTSFSRSWIINDRHQHTKGYQ